MYKSRIAWRFLEHGVNKRQVPVVGVCVAHLQSIASFVTDSKSHTESRPDQSVGDLFDRVASAKPIRIHLPRPPLPPKPKRPAIRRTAGANDRLLSMAERFDPQEKELPTSCWACVSGVSPLSSLDSILTTIQDILDRIHDTDGILDLDAPFNEHNHPQSIQRPPEGKQWVQEARVQVCPYARPNGWRLRFDNRSIVYALLVFGKKHGIPCGWKRGAVDECRDFEETTNLLPPNLSDSFVRVENCTATPFGLLNFFSRYELDESSPQGSITQWDLRKTPEGEKIPPIFIVQFASPAWARAAIREKQSFSMYDRQILLAQYPKQLIPEESSLADDKEPTEKN